MSKSINKLAQRVKDDPFFLASALADYARSEHLDDEALAGVLGCPIETLSLLQLCRRPHSETDLFRQDISKIGTRFQINTDILAEAVRRSDTMLALRRAARNDQGLLMAARDRQEEEPNP